MSEPIVFRAAWRLQAVCATIDDPDAIFFPHGDPNNVKKATRAAKKICAACPAIEECLEEELAHGRSSQHGIRGGLDPHERRRLLRDRRIGERQDAA